ncbi:hypothetical protein [Streptomyces sp. NPDC087437]|uniref:hypothetical protein n=1 Tax=Streptomyces sp. NPDC087437 TaxID=3365789 RepID=UPI00381A02C0
MSTVLHGEMRDVECKVDAVLREIDPFTEFSVDIKNDAEAENKFGKFLTYANFPHMHSYSEVRRSPSSSATAGTTHPSRTSLFHVKHACEST